MQSHTKQPRLRDYLLTVFLFTLFVGTYAGDSGVVAPQRSAVTIADTAIAVDVARTPQEQARGLSGRPSLSESEGMLFIFEQPDLYGFWMPNMHFAIDIVWISSDWRIVDLALQVAPDSYPTVFTPSTPAQYVLEVPAGTVERHGWKAGDAVHF
ncbi:MAG: DUF192 domain-containing protein [bacterium]|nr:DUF192 domain-containing protein [bacterium]